MLVTQAATYIQKFQTPGCCLQLELNHVASLHLNGGLLKSADVSVDIGQLIGLLRTSRHTGLLMTLNASLALPLKIGVQPDSIHRNKRTPGTELMSGSGHISLMPN